MLQKNINANWEVPLVSFRLAPEEGIVTNIAEGGEEIVKIHGEKLPFKWLKWEEIIKFSVKTALILEASFGNLGEIGLDLGVGPRGKLWFLEANSKPNTEGYQEYLYKDSLEKVFGLPLDYSKHLAYEILD